MKTFEQTFKVELSDITPSFGLKPTAVLKYYQETFARYCAKHSVAGYDVYKMGLKWVIGQTVVEYFDTIPIWNEEVVARVYVSNVKKLRIYFNFEVETKRGIVAKGQSVSYILDLETSRPQAVQPIVDKFELTEDNLNGEIVNYDIEKSEELISELEHQITFSDIDYNGHTNNISYVSFGFDAMPTEFVSKKFPKYLKIKYLQETFLNDVLISQIYQNNENFDFKLLNKKDNSEVCLINATWTNNNLEHDTFFEILDELLKDSK